jgi:hypothetical protein
MALVLMLLSLYYVDQPYPKAPEHGIFNVELRFGPGGALLGYFNIGIWDRLGVGLSYGGSNLIGSGDPGFYTQPGVQIRVLAIEEGFVYPSVFFGLDNQGYGQYDGRYEVRSKGVYCLIGRTFVASNLEFVPSLGVNYCLESDNGFDMFMGLKMEFGTFSALLIDYAANFNDPIDADKGYLNTSLRMIFYGEIFFEFGLRDLLDNGPGDDQLNRMIKLGFEQSF